MEAKQAYKRQVKFFDYPDIFVSQKEELFSVIDEVGCRGAFIMQKDLSDFERGLADFCDAGYAVGVANATDGLQLALMAGGIESGDEVIFCSHTMIATASAIHFAGGVPIPVEAGTDLLIDHQKVEKSITERTRAILPTQLNGRMAKMDSILEIAERYGLLVFEDAAQGLGSKFKGKCAGTFGTASCISFYPAKVLGCLGDGGAVLTNDQEIYFKLMQLRDHGRDPRNGEIVGWGFNSRLDNMQAAILHFQLKKYDKVIMRRRSIAALYHDRLKSIKPLVLPPPPESDSDNFDIYQNYEIQAEQRDDLKEFLSNNGIGTLIQWGGQAVHQFQNLGFAQSLPYTERLFERILLLPMNMSINDDDVNFVCDRIIDFYK